MAYRLCKLGVVAGLLATSAAISPSEIPSDLPVSSLLSTAQAHLIKGETHEALVYYDAAISRDPSNYLSIFKRGATYLSLGKTNQATDDFNKVLEISPGFEGAHTQLAKIKAKTADWDGARAEYNAAKLAADSSEIVELEAAEGAASLAQQAFDAGQWDECAQYAGDAILVAGRSAHLRELRAKCRFERNELEEGIVDLRHILSLRPGDTQPHVTVSGVAFYGLGDMDGGMEQIRKCLHSDPESKICKKIHKKEKAISKSFKKVVGQVEKGQTTTAGRSLVGTSDEAGLIADIKEQIETLQTDGSIPSNVKSALYQQVIEMTCRVYVEGSHKDVAKYCDESLQLDENSFWGLFQRGKTQLRAEDFEASIRTLKEAAEKHPDKRERIQPILRKAEVALKRSKSKDYYKVLGVAQDADEKQIKSAYRKASKQFHPDKAAKHGFSKEEAEKKMASINEAYEVLSDPELRARFDRGDDPNDQESQRANPFQQGGHPFMQNFGGRKTQFHFGGQGGARPGGGSGGWPFGGGGGAGGFQFNF